MPIATAVPPSTTTASTLIDPLLVIDKLLAPLNTAMPVAKAELPPPMIVVAVVPVPVTNCVVAPDANATALMVPALSITPSTGKPSSPGLVPT